MKKKLLLATTIFGFLNLTNAQPGQLDPLFGNKGIVLSDTKEDSIGYSSTGRQVLVQPDGSMYLIFEAHNETWIGKRLPDGSADKSYGDKGFAFLEIIYPYAALQPDGKLLVAGNIVTISEEDQGTHYDFEVVRLSSNGSIDNTFGANGKVLTFNAAAAEVGLQSDGKILVAVTSRGGAALARYNADGSLDNSFDNNGLQNLSLSGTPSFAIQNDDKIIVVGGKINSNTTYFDFLVIRLNKNGSVDKTFGNDGIKTNDFGNNAGATSVSIKNNGKIVVAGDVFTSNGSTNFAIA